ncbi:MAG: nucleotidyl transferase AbiEii/AbiGii toxin family protein [Vulcanimicrobiota bacterium]
MKEFILSSEALSVVDEIAPSLSPFYLAEGTGLALHLGHRLSKDLDFFTDTLFNNDIVLQKVAPDNVFYTTEGTIHCERKTIKLSFLYYKEPLKYPTAEWRSLHIADYRDIAAEKVKTISQRGAKKDFIDLYALLQLKIDIRGLCELFLTRFAGSSLNRYHVLRSLVYFDDAEKDPDPEACAGEFTWKWTEIKAYFNAHIHEFDKYLLV